MLLNEHNELMMSAAVQLLSNLYLIGISFLSMVVRNTQVLILGSHCSCFDLVDRAKTEPQARDQ